MVEPIGWASTRGSLHYKTVFPVVPDVGMHVNLHKNLTKRLQPKEAVTINHTNIEVARRILYRQRVALKLFSGSRLNLKGSTAHETSARLHRHLRQNTCPDGFLRDNSDAFSNMKSEGSTLLTEASVYGTLPNINERGRSAMPPIPGSAQSRYSEILETTYDPEKLPDPRGYKVYLKKPIVYKKKYTETEIQNIVRRLTDYDPLTHPAESKGCVRERPSVVTQIPRQSMAKVKKCTAEEVQQIVERLYKSESTKAVQGDSRRKPVVYSGRPIRTQTAPAEIMHTPLTQSHPPPPSESVPEDAIMSED